MLFIHVSQIRRNYNSQDELFAVALRDQVLQEGFNYHGRRSLRVYQFRNQQDNYHPIINFRKTAIKLQKYLHWKQWVFCIELRINKVPCRIPLRIYYGVSSYIVRVLPNASQLFERSNSLHQLQNEKYKRHKFQKNYISICTKWWSL